MNEITVSTGAALLPSAQQWSTIQGIANAVATANNLSPAKMTNIILWGNALGLTIPASIELIQNVLGKTSLAPRGAWALVQNSPVIAETKLTRLTDPKGAFVGYECYIRRQNGFEFTGRWTLEQAKAAGVVKPGSGWEHYPENMCMWRAIGFACDVAASDVTCGLTAFMKMPEQYGLEIDGNGNIIDAVSVSVPTPAPIDPVTAELNKLVDIYGVDAVMAASGGVIPATLADCVSVGMTLEMADNRGEGEESHE